MSLTVIWSAFLAALNLLGTAAKLAAAREQTTASRAVILVEIFQHMTAKIEKARHAQDAFDRLMHDEPDGVYVDDKYKRPTNRAREPS